MKKQHAYKIGRAFRVGLAFAIGKSHKRFAGAMDDDKWITVKPHGEESDDYQHIRIDSDTGEITAGLGGKFNGTNIDDLPRGKNPHPIDEKKYQAWKKRKEERSNASQNNDETSSAGGGKRIWDTHDRDKMSAKDKQELKKKLKTRSEEEYKKYQSATNQASRTEHYMESAQLENEIAWLDGVDERDLPNLVLEGIGACRPEKGKIWTQAETYFGKEWVVMPGSPEFAYGAKFSENLEKRVFERADYAKKLIEHESRVKENIKNNPYKESKSVAEAEDLAKSWIGDRFVNYSGFTKDNCNNLNKALLSYLEKYPAISNMLNVYGGRSGMKAKIDAHILKSLENDPEALSQMKKNAEYSFNLQARHIERHGLKGKLVEIFKQWRFLPKNGDFTEEEAKEFYIKKYIEKQAKSIYGKEFSELTEFRFPSLVGGVATNKGLVLNTEINKKETAKLFLGNCGENTFHPPTSKPAAFAVAAHELGHIVANTIDYDRRGSQDTRALSGIEKIFSEKHKTDGEIKRKLSEYANTNSDEMIAESFCEVMSSDNPREFARSIVNEITDIYNKKMETYKAAYEKYKNSPSKANSYKEIDKKYHPWKYA